MLLPALGFVVGCGFFGIVGLVVLGIWHRRFGLMPLLCFVAGAMVSAAGAGWLYGHVVADAQGQLQSRASVIGLFGVLLVAGVGGGAGAVLLLTKRRVA
jgi:hypothetical protein